MLTFVPTFVLDIKWGLPNKKVNNTKDSSYPIFQQNWADIISILLYVADVCMFIILQKGSLPLNYNYMQILVSY